MIKDINQLDFTKRYTYADYLTWQFDEMVELIKGQIFKMSPAPGRLHQKVSGNLYHLIRLSLQQKQCEIYSAPFDVRLPLPKNQQSANKIDTVVQPDLCVICDPSKLDDHGCNGAPDWIIEILSKSTAQKDLNEKFEIYQNAGVTEYWVVHPYEHTVLIYLLQEDGTYRLLKQKPFTKGDHINSHTLPGLELDLHAVFE